MILGNSSRCVVVAGLVDILVGFVVVNCCVSRSTVLSLSRLSLSKAGEPNGRLGKASRMVPLPLAPFSAVLLLGDDTTTDRPPSCIWWLLDLSQFSSAHKLWRKYKKKYLNLVCLYVSFYHKELMKHLWTRCRATYFSLLYNLNLLNFFSHSAFTILMEITGGWA